MNPINFFLLRYCKTLFLNLSVFIPIIAMSVSACTLVKTKEIEATATWDGICGSGGQPGSAVTLRFNTALSTISDPLFTGSCGALGEFCEFNGNTAYTTDTDDGGFSGSQLSISTYSNSNCSGEGENTVLSGYLPSNATVASLHLRCADRAYFGISIVPNQSDMVPVITLLSASTSPLIGCSLPLSEFGGATQVCIPCS